MSKTWYNVNGGYDMKKYNLLKVLALTFAIVVLLSWVIPAGLYSNGTFTSADATVPAGLYDLFLLPVVTLSSFAQYGLLFLAIGGFYGLINKTGVYSNLVDSVVKKFKGKEKTFVIVTIVMMTLLSSLTNLTSALLVVVPFLVAILLSMGYNKITAFASTIGAILVGQIGTTYGFNLAGYLSYYLKFNIHAEILTKFIMLAILTFILVMFVLKGAKQKTNKKEEVEIPLLENVSKKKSSLPLVVISIIVLLIAIVGMYNWYNAFNFTFFKDIHDSITSYEINGYPIFSNLLGSISEFGFLSNYDLIVLLVLAALLIGWVYNVKFNEMIDGFVDGMKQMLKPAFYAVIASLIFSFVYYNASKGSFVNTVVNTLMGEKFSLPSTMATGAVLGFFYNDFTVLASNYYGIFASFDANQLPIIGVLLQSMYGLVMLLAPTSIFLMGGLAYLNVSFKEWIKYIWKFALIALGIIAVIGIIMVAFI